MKGDPLLEDEPWVTDTDDHLWSGPFDVALNREGDKLGYSSTGVCNLDRRGHCYTNVA